MPARFYTEICITQTHSSLKFYQCQTKDEDKFDLRCLLRLEKFYSELSRFYLSTFYGVTSFTKYYVLLFYLIFYSDKESKFNTNLLTYLRFN